MPKPSASHDAAVDDVNSCDWGRGFSLLRMPLRASSLLPRTLVGRGNAVDEKSSEQLSAEHASGEGTSKPLPLSLLSARREDQDLQIIKEFGGAARI